MRKRLLMMALAVVSAATAFAYQDGSYVYTVSQRLKVQGDNLVKNGNFADGLAVGGWTDAAGAAVDTETWGTTEGVGPEGEAALTSLESNEGKAFCMRWGAEDGLQEGQKYLVSFQIKAADDGTAFTTAIGTTVAANYVDFFLNTDGSFAKVASTDEAPVVNVAAATSVATQWTTVIYTFEYTGGQFLVMHLEKLPTGAQITNLTVQAYNEVYDDRIMQRKIDYAEKLLADPNFNTEAAAAAKSEFEEGAYTYLKEMLASAAEGSMDDATAMEDMEVGFDEGLAAYLDASSLNVSSLLKGVQTSDLTAQGKINRGDNTALTKYFPNLNLTGGNWQHAANKDYIHSLIQGSFANSGTYNAYHVDFPAGKYFITGEIRNCYVDKNYNQTFTLETMCKIFVGKDSVEIGPIVGETYQKFYLVGNVDEDGAFRAGFDWPGHTAGSAFFVKNVEVRSFDMDIQTKVDHIQAYKTYKTQWDAAVAARSKVLSLVDQPNYPWGQNELKAERVRLDAIWGQQYDKHWLTEEGADAGIATTDEFTDWALYQGVEEYTEPDTLGNTKRKEFQVVRGYQAAYNANIALNKPLTDFATAIDEAKKTRNAAANASGDRAAYKTAILDAIASITSIRNATSDATRVADSTSLADAQAKLAAATEAFLATVELKPFIDIDFSQKAVLNEETGVYSIAGTSGSITFSAFEPDNTVGGTSFSQGHSGTLEDILRVGNGAATVTLDSLQIPTDTDIFRATFDVFHGNLSGKNFYADLRNAAGERIAGFSVNRYNGSLAYNEFDTQLTNGGEGMDILGYATGVGSSSASNTAIAADNNRTSYDLMINYATGVVKGIIKNPQKGTKEGIEIAIPTMADNKVASFVMGSNYNNADRRCWFDNLKLYKWAGAGASEEDLPETGWAAWNEVVDGIQTVKAAAPATRVIYNLNGQMVKNPGKGLYIINGKKVVIK